jgi:cellulose synthase/poly-beta-1,6-N-acetylglucosamine synthase-like glycosyltransferase
MILVQIIFWFSVYGLFHSYVVYPVLLRLIATNKKNNQELFTDETLPQVSFVMSLYNEASVIEEKLQTLIDSDYPTEKLNILIGSDCSDDATHQIVQQKIGDNPSFYFYPFETRRGKPSVINDLVDKAGEKAPFTDNHVLIISDANVMLETNTIRALAKHFKNEKIGLVDSNIIPPKVVQYQKDGIAASEKSYISGEVAMKHLEGKAWGRAMGPLGGCYAIRARLFEPVPPNNLVDDFYIAMKVFEKGALAINEPQAICYESVPNRIEEEFRRKTRISQGNFTNLATFKHLLWPIWSSLSFAFLSHKVLRWFGPFFILTALGALAILAIIYNNLFYVVLLILMLFGLFGIPILDWLFRKMNFNVAILRYITYFNAMNLALFNGFIKYLKGGQNGIWQPTKRDS